MCIESKVLIITGTRPEVIKMAPVFHALKKKKVYVDWCHTGQHEELAIQAFNIFNIIPTHVLLRPDGNNITTLLSGLMNSVQEVIESQRYRAVLVHGDTTTTLAGAKAAFYNQIPIIAHIEAGLRSGDLYHPFPEESNRILVSKLATKHYAPTLSAYAALVSEGVNTSNIILTGNTVIDAQNYLLDQGIVSNNKSNIVIVTAHRRENWNNISTICRALIKLSELRPELIFKFLVHPNPIIRVQIEEILSDNNKIHLVESLDYFELQKLLASAKLVITDSGGIQEETPTYRIPTVVLRKTTERPEAINEGFSVLAGAECEGKIIKACLLMLDKTISDKMKNPFGDGKASLKIADDLVRTLNVI
ncbi:non-hydrolyzing UDP-N-acetylglucosamine 2-epimerase [Photobacterium phosphoreum]|uniref:non-hydrolyzing UDP-N-acetylglucosamine 2-epimerase n=1 Tax=Photobacterium phosphoreum TaxID=659 RepID=UPI001E652B88|nr:UDP-N-acetylglucosamine 2-epimerase (non-hydrolyzing) [Photobacterium phosphoreum]MCD9505343.1 UDP-N-acetylglucosamine 2-epimerase (non-hydrolyzing) [Photobacterium phosphoreum]